jgi:hypothetical protein
MDTRDEETVEALEVQDKWGLTTNGGAALGTGLISIPSLMHFGTFGLVAAGCLTLVAFRHGDQIIGSGKQFMGKAVKVPTSRGIGDRVLGRKRDSKVSDAIEIEDPVSSRMAAMSFSNEGSLAMPQTRFEPSEMRKNILPVRGVHQQDSSLAGNIFPQYPEDETLRLGTETKKKYRFDPWIDDFFGKGMIVAAVQGSGKSMLCGLIIEQAAKCGVPAIVFDHKGEYAGIVDLPFVNGIRAGSDRLRSKAGCFELSIDNADDFVHLIMERRHQAIIHLPSYGDGWLDRAEIVAAVGQALMRYSARQRELSNPLIPCLVFQDEAQLYIPQDPKMLPPEARKNSDVLESLNNAYFALVSNGRSNGYTMCFATPSLTYVAKAMIKSCQIKILMRHAEKNDLDMCEQIVNGVVTRQEIESMPVGTGVVFGFTQKPMVVKFDTRQSRDLSETPGIKRLRMKETSPRSVQTMILPEEELDIDPKGTRRLEETDVIEPLSPRQPPSHRPSNRVSPELQEALRLYQEGITSYRELGAAMQTTKYQGEVYIKELKRRKLIN